MAQAGYTPIQLYYSTTAAAVPVNTNLANGELAINVTDGKLFYKDNSNVVQVIGWKTVPISAGGTGQTTASAAFNALSPITTTGDLIVGNGTNSATRLGIGANGYILTSNGTTATWSAAPAAQVYPGAGIPNSTGSAWGTSYTTSGSGTVVALNNSPTLTNPTVTNYVETLYSANSSTAITINLSNGTFQYITLTGNATITMPTAAAGKSFILLLAQDATGSRTVTWSTVVWPGGTAPTITSTASKKDLYSFFSDGTNWYGVTISQNY